MSPASQPGISRTALALRWVALLAVAVAAGVLAMDWFRPVPVPQHFSVPPPATTPPAAGKPFLVRHRPAESSATVAAQEPPPASFHPTVENGREYQPVSFRKLAGFPCPVAADEATTLPAGLIPPEIQALHGQQVEVIGFMVPLETEGAKVKSFALVKDRMLCCFGVIPKLNEWILVQMRDGASANYFPDQPVRVLGRLDVGEYSAGESVLGLYRMEADNLHGPRRQPVPRPPGGG
ncbi:MAG: DUF3299 domain-containing protein [Candidatus Sumerlaeaceae bacterium]|nr:DUF3299 domain-containing protein [Candidatus Sumerlaeaceae bacterium]